MSGLHTKRNPVTGTKTERDPATSLHVARQAIAAGGGGGAVSYDYFYMTGRNAGGSIDVRDLEDFFQVDTVPLPVGSDSVEGGIAVNSAGDIAYMRLNDGVYAISLPDGGTIWSVTPPSDESFIREEASNRAVLTSDESLVCMVTGRDKDVHVFDTSDGSVVHSHVGTGFVSYLGLSLDEQYLYMKQEVSFQRMDLSTGVVESLVSYEGQGVALSLDQTLLVLGNYNDSWRCYDFSDPDNVSVLWTSSAPSHNGLGGFFSADNSVVYLGSNDGIVYARDAVDGSEIWTSADFGSFSVPILLDEGRGKLYVTGTLSTPSSIIDISDGSRLSTISTEVIAGTPGPVMAAA